MAEENAEIAPEKKGAVADKKEAAKPAKKGNPLMVILIAVGGLLVMGGLAAVVVFTVVMPAARKSAAGENGENKAVHKVEAAEMGPVHLIKDLVINSADPDEIHYIKVGMAIELDGKVKKSADGEGQAAGGPLQEFDPIIRDLLITEFSKHTVRDLNTPGGRDLVRKALLHQLSEKLVQFKFKNIYFTDYVGQ